MHSPRIKALTNTAPDSRKDWADDEEFDDSSALPAQTVTTNKDGTKTVTSYRFNDDGKKVKTTRRIRTTVVKEHVNPRVAERKAWPKFGLEKGHAVGPSFDTTSVGENIIFRPSINWKANAKEEKPDKNSMKEQLKDKKVKCRICNGEHFTARCPFKDTMAPIGEDGAGAGAGGMDGDGDGEPAVGGLGAGGSSYVPPHLRGNRAGAGAGERMGGKYERDDLATLRVTNVSALSPFHVMASADDSVGLRIRRGTGPSRHVRAVRTRDESLPRQGQRDGSSQRLRVHQLPGAD